MPMRKFFTLQFDTKIFNPDKSILSYSTEGVDDEVAYKAPDHCIDTIMNFARAYRVEETKSAGKVEVVMN
jgi:hypothetical protein